MSSTAQKGSDRLVEELRESIDSQSRQLKDTLARQCARRDAALQMLSAVVSFLQSWDELETNDASIFPSETVRDAFHFCLAEMGPGDAKVRATLLETISSLSTNETRQAVLDVMPWTVPVESTELEEATKQILDSLRKILQDDAQALLPVLGCLALLPLSPKGRAEAWNVALSSLPVVSEADLPVLVRTLLCNVTNEEDATRALEALRTEFELLQSIENDQDENNDEDDSISLLSHVLLGAFQDRENGSLISKAYIDILNDVSIDEVQIADDSSSNAESPPFLVLDAIAVLALYQNRDQKTDMESLADTWMEHDTFPFSAFLLLLDTISLQSRHDTETPSLSNRLVPPLLSLAMFLLLAPVRIGTLGNQRNDLQRFIIELHRCLDDDNQAELVQCLLHLGEETTRDRERVADTANGQVVRRENSGISTQREGLKMVAGAIYSLLKQVAITSRGSVARFKDTLVGRLLSLTNDGTPDDLKSTHDLCSLLTGLVDPTNTELGGEAGIATSEMMILLQKLLFTASYSADRRTKGESSLDVGRIIRGLMLATELLQSDLFSRSDKECIHQWVHRILLPSTRRTVDPEIGSCGLRFLSAWSTYQQSASTATIVDRPMGDEKVFDMFQSFKMILANTGLIQMQSLYLERRKRKKRDMIFCVYSYVRASNAQHPSRWGDLTTWVYNLVDMYLTMGREGTNNGSRERNRKGRPQWLPDGWLEASLELPNLNLSVAKTGRKSGTGAKVLSSELCTHEVSFDLETVPKSVCSEVANGLCEGKTVDQMHMQVESVLLVTLSFLLGAGLSAAVLRNTYAHLLNLDDMNGNESSEEDMRRRHEIVKLIQYQVMKIYDLRRKTETSLRLLEALEASIRKASLRGKRSAGSAARRRSRDAAFQKIVSTIETACQQTRQVLSVIFCSSGFIDAEILMRCLVDSGDEGALVDGLKASSSSGPPIQFKMILELRRSLLSHLSALYLRSAIHDASVGDSAMSEIASVIETASTISRMLPTFRKTLATREFEQEEEGHVPDEADATDLISILDVSALSSSYFRMVKMILVKALRQADETSTREKGSSGPSFLGVLLKCFADSNAADSSVNAAQDTNTTSLAFNSLLCHLRVCEDEATVLELLDILSLISSKDSELRKRAIEACWRVLHTEYSVLNQNVPEPSARDELPHTFQGALELGSTSQEIHKVVSATIVKTATADARNAQGSDILRHSFLLLWSLAALSQDLSGFDCWYKITTELVQFLDALDGSSSNAEENPSEQENDERSQRLQRRGKRTRSRAIVSSIPGLTLDTYSSVYEWVLHASVATFAVSPHALTDVTEGQASPFHHHHEMVRHIGCLLDLFVSKFDLFPRRILSTVLACCKQLLTVCTLQVDGCVQWRNAQPILSVEEKRAGVHDYGSIKFLEQLLQSFATWGAGKVLSFAQRLRRVVSPFVESDSDESREPFATVPQNDKRITSLMLSAQRTMDMFGDVATAHNLVAPQFDSDAVENPSEEQETATEAFAVDHADKGYHELDVNEECHTERHGEGNPKRKRRRVAPTLISTVTSGAKSTESANEGDSPKLRKLRRPIIEEDDYDWDEDNDIETERTPDGFGVSGKWGDEDEEAEDDESSSGSLELEVSDIFQST